MSNATELLRRALDAWDENEPNDFNDCMEEIRAYLNTENEAEPVFIRPDHLALARKSPFLCQVGPVQVADFVPLYTRPEPARKPLPEKIDPILRTAGSMKYHPSYVAGWNNCIDAMSNGAEAKKPMTDDAEDEAFNSASKYAAWLETENRMLREARKPMTEEEIDEELETNEYYCAKSFADGVRWAEKHHQIGLNKSDPDSIDLQSRCRGDKL